MHSEDTGSVARRDPNLVRGDIATYVSEQQVCGDVAYETAFHWLMDSLACAFQALEHPECSRLLGPVVPGATMAGGARVPGTSYELDPVQAAFNIGAMTGWRDAIDAPSDAGWGHPSNDLGGILAVADYLSRKAVAEGKAPLIVQDVLATMIKAHQVQRFIAPDRGFDALDRAGPTRVAAAAVVTAMLGGTKEQVLNAVSNAWADGGSMNPSCHPPDTGEHMSRAVGDATSRGVRLALIAVAVGPGYPLPATSIESAAPPKPQAKDGIGRIAATAIGMQEPGLRILERFTASTAAHFPPAQASRIKALFADRARFEATPVHEFVSALVRNH